MSGLTNPPGNDLSAPKSANDEEATRIFAPQPAAIVAAEAIAAAAAPSPLTPTTTGTSAAAKVAPSLASITTGTILAHTYEIEALLARGGMGEVYRARHTELGSQHAIKVILPQLASEARFISLFQEEARKLRRVRDDAVVGYEGLFLDENGLRYLVMEFVDGPSLAQVMTERRLSMPELLQLRDRIARGLAAAHDKGIFHRDISPDNIILVENRADQAKIIDFGIAKSTEPGDRTVVGQDFAGKYSWVSPEQLGLYGGKVDGRSDIYSLGLVLAAAVIGRPLPMGNSPISVIEARRAVPSQKNCGRPSPRSWSRTRTTDRNRCATCWPASHRPQGSSRRSSHLNRRQTSIFRRLIHLELPNRQRRGCRPDPPTPLPPNAVRRVSSWASW